MTDTTQQDSASIYSNAYIYRTNTASYTKSQYHTDKHHVILLLIKSQLSTAHVVHNYIYANNLQYGCTQLNFLSNFEH